MFCTSCGASNPEDAQFCVNCGESVGEDQGNRESSRIKGLKDISLLRKGSFARALFDFSFNHFCTARIIRVLYGLATFSAGLIAVLLIIFGFRASTAFGIFAGLVGAPLIFVGAVIGSRIGLELMLAIFRIADALNSRGEKPEPKDGIQWNV
ncbi:MAG: DUF4282 domain-containing protein [Thermodesulfobacteriota bacterium]